MIYFFRCYECDTQRPIDSEPFSPPAAPRCQCGEKMDRVYGARIDTSGCRDANWIPPESRVVDTDFTPANSAQAARKEAMFNRAISNRRKLVAQDGNRGSFRHTHSVPAELYHGKIRETRDKSYWDDPKNRDRHKNCRVDDGPR